MCVFKAPNKSVSSLLNVPGRKTKQILAFSVTDKHNATLFRCKRWLWPGQPELLSAASPGSIGRQREHCLPQHLPHERGQGQLGRVFGPSDGQESAHHPPCWWGKEATFFPSFFNAILEFLGALILAWLLCGSFGTFFARYCKDIFQVCQSNRSAILGNGNRVTQRKNGAVTASKSTKNHLNRSSWTSML